MVARDVTRLIPGLVLIALAAAGAIAIGNMRNQPSPPPTVTAIPRTRVAAEPAVAAAYRYPLGCLGDTLSGLRPAPAARRVDRTGPCWHYGVYLTVVLRDVGRVWRMGLEAISPLCPAVSLPGLVRAQLVICRRTAGKPAGGS